MMRMLVAVAVVGALVASVAIACHHSEYERDVLSEQFNEIAEQFTGNPDILEGGHIPGLDGVSSGSSSSSSISISSGGTSVSSSSSSSSSGSTDAEYMETINNLAGATWNDPQAAVNQLAALRDYVGQRVTDFSNMNLAEWMDPSWAYDADGNIKDTYGPDGVPDGIINKDDTWTNSSYRDNLIDQLNAAMGYMDELINQLVSKYNLPGANASGWQIGDRDEWSGEAPTGSTEPSGPVPTVVPPTTTGTNTAQVAEDK